MTQDDIAAMCEDHNNKKIGGRGIRNYINGTIKAEIAKIMLDNRAKPGTIRINNETANGTAPAAKQAVSAPGAKPI